MLGLFCELIKERRRAMESEKGGSFLCSSLAHLHRAFSTKLSSKERIASFCSILVVAPG